MGRYTKIPLKKRQKLGLASAEESIRRRNQVKRKKSAYGERLDEKQKLKFMYGVMERQLERYVREAAKKAGDPQLEVLKSLEMRLDNVVYRLGLGKTREQARQLVNHGHILLDDKKVDIPSYSLKPGQRILFKDKTIKKGILSEKVEANRKDVSVVGYLEYESNGGRVLSEPGKDDLAQNVDISKVMEFYHKV